MSAHTHALTSTAGGDVFNTVDTAAYRTAQHVCAAAVRHGGIAVLYGPPGCGKTYALEAFLTTVDRPTVAISAAPQPSPKQIFEELLIELTGTVDTMTTSKLRRHCIQTLNEIRPLVAIDEAQNLTKLWLRQLRSLHDEGKRTWPLILVGDQDCLERLDASPALKSRAALRAEFAPLRGEVLLTTLAAAHPILAKTPPRLLTQIDERHGRGNLRNWSEFCRYCFDLVERSGTRDRLTHKTVAATFQLMAGR